MVGFFFAIKLTIIKKIFTMKEKQQNWASVILLLAGASLLALNLPLSKWAFPIMAIARIWLSTLMYKRKDWPLFIMNSFYVVVDIVGIMRWF
jgi:hypothetical protein